MSVQFEEAGDEGRFRWEDNSSCGFFLSNVFSQDVTDHSNMVHGSKHGLGSDGFHWSNADNLVVLARRANCTYVHLARLVAGFPKAGLDVHDVAHASGGADILGYEDGNIV